MKKIVTIPTSFLMLLFVVLCGYAHATNSAFNCTTPVITTQPVNATICAGLDTSFTVIASGDSLSYQWQVKTGGRGGSFTNISNGGVYSGATSDSLIITGATTSISGYEYQCVITGCSSYVTSNVVTLTVSASESPIITSQPANDTACINGNASFYVASSNVGITYQWQQNSGSGFTTISSGGIYSIESSSSSSEISISEAADSINGYQYRCILSNLCLLSDTSATALLISNLPSPITLPVDALICASSDTSFSIKLNNTSGVTFQWQVKTMVRGGSFTNISNGGVYSEATSDSLILTDVPDSMNGYQYQCVLTGACTDYSNSATLSVASGTPTITSQPANDTVCIDGDAYFYVYSSGPGITYQWQQNSGSGFTNIAASGGDIGYSFINTIADSMNGYQYRCILSNVCSLSDTSATATLISNLPGITAQPVDALICASSDTSFTVQLSDTSGVTFQWQVKATVKGSFTNISNGGVYSGATTDSLILTDVPSTMNGYQYQCILTGACTPYSNTATLTLHSPTITASATPTTICYNSSSTLTASGASTYTWSPTTNLNDSTGSSVITTLTATTTYTVTGTDSNGCVNTATDIINVYPQLFAHSGGNKSVCTFSYDTLGGSPAASGGTPPYTYSWFGEGGDSVFSTVTNPVIYVNHQDIYTLTVTDSAGCKAGDTALTTLFTVNAGLSDTILYGSSDTLGARYITSGGTAPFTYSWSSKPTGFTSASANPAVTPTVTTTYTLSVTDSTGCVATDSLTIAVLTIDSVITLNTPKDSVQSYTSTNFTDTIQWYQFANDSQQVTISIPGDSTSANITSLALICTSCPGITTINEQHKTAGSATTLSLTSDGLIAGNTYYVAVMQPPGNNTSYILNYASQKIPLDSACSFSTVDYPPDSTYQSFNKAGWATIFLDSFANDSKLRTDYWCKTDYRTYWIGGNATQDDSTNDTIINGHLRLLQTKIANPANYIRYTTISVNNGDTTVTNHIDSATNGEVSTRRPDASLTVTFLPNVYVESESWLNFVGQPTTDPAVWLWNGYGACTGPGISNYSEIDNFEFGNPWWFKKSLLTLHWPSACDCNLTNGVLTGKGNGNSEATWYTIANYPSGISDIRTGWHTWGMLYTPDSVGWYLDNKNIKTDTDRAHIYLQPMILDIDDAIPYNNPILYPINYTTMNQSWMDIDYVKVYTNVIPIESPVISAEYPTSICFQPSLANREEFILYKYPGVTYDWSNGAGSDVFTFSDELAGTYSSTFTGSSTSKTGDTVWVKFIGASSGPYPLKITLNGLAPVLDTAGEHLGNGAPPSKSISQTFNIFINPVTVTPATSTICCYGQLLAAKGSSFYTWSPAYGLSATTGDSVIAGPAVATTYTVTASPANACGNTAVAVVNGPCVAESPGDTICSECLSGCTTTDVQKKAINTVTTITTSEYVKTYPNPNNGSFTLELSTGSSSNNPIHIQLFNILGQMVYEQYTSATNGYLQQQIQPPAIDNGVYVVSVSTGKTVFHQTVIISKY